MSFTIVKDHRIYEVNLGVNSIIIDLGANKGEFYSEMQRKFNATCFAVEPNFYLFQNILLDESHKFNGAICTSDGPVTFHLSENDEASSMMKDFGSHWGSSKEVVVKGISWKTLLQYFNLQNKTIDILKIDIEGAELDLIESLDENDIKRIKQITIEFHDWLNKDLHISTVKMIQKLVSSGFSCFISAPSHDWPIEALFVRSETLNFNLSQRIAMKIFKRLSFLNYSRKK